MPDHHILRNGSRLHDDAAPADAAPPTLALSTTPTPSSATTQPSQSTTLDPATTTTVAGMGFDEYLVGIVNANAAETECGSTNESDLNDAQPDNPTPAEELDYVERYFAGNLDCVATATNTIAALLPPAEVAASHGAYVDARRAFVTALLARGAAASTTEDYFVLMRDLFQERGGAFGDQCRTLEDIGQDNGWDAGLDCPSAPPTGAPTDVAVFASPGEWLAVPTQVTDTGTGVSLAITNPGDEPVEVVVVALFEGDPANLPMVNGVLDSSRCNQFFAEPDPHPAYFGCELPSPQGEGDPFEVDEIAAGDSVSFSVFGPGVFVVFDYRSGAYEAGEYVVIEIVADESGG